MLKKKIFSWKVSIPSQAGKNCLTKYVASSIPVHKMYVLHLPKRTIDEIDKMYSQFSWGDSDKNKKIHTINWNEIRRPIGEGELGIRHSRDNNLAQLVKTCWRCLSNEKFVPKYLKLNIVPISLFGRLRVGRETRFWKGFVEAVDFINDKIGWIIGNGEYISVWNNY